MPTHVRHFGLIPAAGGGERFGGAIPKQYAMLAGRPLLAHAIDRLAVGTPLVRTFVVLAPGDRRFDSTIGRRDRVVPVYCGGASRAASVRNGLALMRGEAHARDWVLVHDAARPCLDRALLTRLLVQAGEDEVGGLLAIPVADTLKRERASDGSTRAAGGQHSADGGEASAKAVGDRPSGAPGIAKPSAALRVGATVERGGLWQAQTPQMFRYGVLLEALAGPGAEQCTDEAQAIEALGLSPRLVMGSKRNLKVTWPDDLGLAEAILGQEAGPR
jgi:2-C-methyl-D-erythritol 4-phosphate cytidylyltransferase